ncbi:class I SAM-dependent methyltransferase [Inhella sp.]|uniref:class I SAM-dependent methyltransferase n=1 Tax=Inhella sp. TaxID=1921806 RepID=UPI0035B0FC7F
MQATLNAQATFWNRLARKYAADPIADIGGYAATLQRVRGLLRPEHEVLEIGCGTGTTALSLAGATRRYVASDLAPEMVAIAREKLAAQPTPGLQFEVADATAPHAQAKAFDVLLAFNALHLLPDLDTSLAQALRPLRPGGLFISKTACVGEMHPLVGWLGIPLARLLGKAPPVLVFKAPALVAALERQGLRIEAVERHGTQDKDIRVFIVARKP